MNLKDKAIDIKGKKYVLVSDRILYFNENFKNGSISTELVTPVDSALIIVKASIRPDLSDSRLFTAYSQAIIGDGYINKTSALENAETSAVGRALAFMGIGVIDSVASVDEINKTTHYKAPQPKNVETFMQDLQMEEGELIKWQESMEACTTLKELQAVWKRMPVMAQDKLVGVKEQLKAKLGGK